MEFKYFSKFVGRGCKRYFIVCTIGDKSITVQSTGDNAITRSMADNAKALDIIAATSPQDVVGL